MTIFKSHKTNQWQYLNHIKPSNDNIQGWRKTNDLAYDSGDAPGHNEFNHCKQIVAAFVHQNSSVVSDLMIGVFVMFIPWKENESKWI